MKTAHPPVGSPPARRHHPLRTPPREGGVGSGGGLIASSPPQPLRGWLPREDVASFPSPQQRTVLAPHHAVAGAGELPRTSVPGLAGGVGGGADTSPPPAVRQRSASASAAGSGRSLSPMTARRGPLAVGGSPPRGRDTPVESVRGGRVTRNTRHWKWADQDGGPGCLGTAIAEEDGWVTVLWDKTGKKNNYRWGHMGAYDVSLVVDAPSPPVAAAAATTATIAATARPSQGRNPALGRARGGPSGHGVALDDTSDTF